MSTETDAKIDLDALTETQVGRGGMFEYMPGDGFLHRMNPVTKVVLATSITIVALTSLSYQLPVALLSVVLVGLLFAGVLPRVGLLSVMPGVTLAGPLFVFHGLFNPRNETVLFAIGGVPVVDQVTFYVEGVKFAATIFSPLLVLIVTVITILVTTHPKRLMIAMIEKGLPPKVAYVFLASLQFVPQMQRQAREILDAQQARGLDTGANIKRRFHSLIDMLAPLLIGMLIATETRSLALESRGFTRSNERVYLFDVPDRPIDRGLRWVAGIGVVAGLARQVILWV